MRDIKFRAWDTKDKKMIPRSEYFTLQSALKNDVQFFGFIANKYYIMDYEFMQFTGLHDKNGKEIYEGDIIKRTVVQDVFHCHGDFLDNYESIEIGVVDWDTEGFEYCVKEIKATGRTGHWVSIGTMSFDYWVGCEIIGNIYENPELLK